MPIQGVWDSLFFLIIAVVGCGVAYWRGKAANRDLFLKNLMAGKIIHETLKEHAGALNKRWFFAMLAAYVLIAVIASVWLAELLRFDLDSNGLLVLMGVVGAVAFVPAFFLFKKMDRVPPQIGGREE